ncbi:MAG: TonB-dependent receptor [Alphaproteobacteria bacterium]
MLFQSLSKSSFRLTSVAALALTVGISPAFAQTAVDEIIVTAQKREQSLQDVPLAISAFTADNIDNKVIDDGVDLSFSVPNLTTDILGSSLRGIGNLAISSTAESGLGYHVNGVYLGSAATEAEYFDLERIEVLRGPQGTLYGRNTTAGVINIITAKATDEFEGYVTAGYGNYYAKKLEAAINIPIADGFATRLAGFYLDRDGYAFNQFTGNNVDDRNMFGLRSSTKFEVGNTRADLVVSYFEEDDKRLLRPKVLCVADPALGCSPLENGFGVPDSRSTIFNTLGAATGLFAPGVNYFSGSVNPADARTLNEDLDPTYNTEEFNALLEINHDFGDLAFTSLSSYQELSRNRFKDFDRLAPSIGISRPITFDLFGNGSSVTTENISNGRRDLSDSREFFQEFRLASGYSGSFNFIFGTNYYNQKASASADFTSVTIAAAQQLTPGLGEDFDSLVTQSDPIKTESYGLFGEVYYDLSDRTRLTGGLRYSHDDKTILTRQIFLLAPGPGGSVPDFTFGEFSKGAVTGRAVIDHYFSDDLLGFVSVSRGYKAGGINPGEAGVETKGFDPEYVNATEAGIKSSLFDGKLTSNLSAFYYDYQDLQIGRTTATAAITVNTDATIMGAEGEFVFRPNDFVQFDASISLLDTEINDFTSADPSDPLGTAPGTVVALATPVGVLKDLDGNRLPSSPGSKFAFGAQIEIPLGDFVLTPRIDHYAQGGFASTVFNKPVDEFDGYSQTDLKLLLTPESGNWELRGYVKNISDNDDITRVLPAGETAGRFREIVILEPRTYGVEATVKF